MRFLFVVVAAAIGWLWFAARAPAEPAPAPSLQVRRADLTDLGAQVAMAKTTTDRAGADIERAGAHTDIDLDTEHEHELANTDGYFEDAGSHEDEDSTLEDPDAELADLAEQAQLAIYNRPPPEGAIDLSAHGAYGEIIQIEDHAPIIDVGSTRCGGVTIEHEYIVHIPVGRTFESVLAAAEHGAPNDDEYTPPHRTFGLGDEVVTFSSGGLVENEYILDEPAIDQPADEPPPVWEIE
jgi:hypothetical protein